MRLVPDEAGGHQVNDDQKEAKAASNSPQEV